MSSIDVAVPCYQHGRYLRDCVTSITSQDVKNLRVLIINNGSTDDTLKVANALAQEDERVSIVHHPRNLGQKHAYNEAIAWASAKYFMILDADDVLPPGSILRALSVMENSSSIAFCHGPEYAVPFPAGSPPSLAIREAKPGWTIETGPEFVRRVCRQPINPAGATGIVVRTDAQEKAGYYNPSLDHTDDLEMWLRLACLCMVAQTETVQGIRRVHPHQLTRYFDSTYLRDCEERLTAFESFFSGDGKSLPKARALYRCAERSLASKAYWSSLSHLARGYRSTSISLMKFALGHCPIMALVPPLDWLARTESPWERLKSILATSLPSRRGTASQLAVRDR
jgi:glycosyltransferase involved in cell wall biosynthesis